MIRARISKVALFTKEGLFHSYLELDSRKYDEIGFTKESLRKYISLFLKSGMVYCINSDKIIAFNGRSWKTVETIKYDLNNQ